MDDIIDLGIDAKHSNEDEIATFILWIETALIGQLVPWMLETLTAAGTFFVFALFCIPVPFILKRIPETKGMSLEDIEKVWR